MKSEKPLFSGDSITKEDTIKAQIRGLTEKTLVIHFELGITQIGSDVGAAIGDGNDKGKS